MRESRVCTPDAQRFVYLVSEPAAGDPRTKESRDWCEGAAACGGCQDHAASPGSRTGATPDSQTEPLTSRHLAVRRSPLAAQITHAPLSVISQRAGLSTRFIVLISTHLLFLSSSLCALSPALHSATSSSRRALSPPWTLTSRSLPTRLRILLGTVGTTAQSTSLG